MPYGNKRLGRGLQRKRPHDPIPAWAEESMEVWLGANGVGRHGGGFFRHKDTDRSPVQVLRLHTVLGPSRASAEAVTGPARPSRTYLAQEVSGAVQRYCANNLRDRCCPNTYPASGYCKLYKLSEHPCFGHGVPRLSGGDWWLDQELIGVLEEGNSFSEQGGGSATGQPTPDEMREALRAYCKTTSTCSSYGCKINQYCSASSYPNPDVRDAHLPAAFELIRGLV